MRRIFTIIMALGLGGCADFDPDLSVDSMGPGTTQGTDDGSTGGTDDGSTDDTGSDTGDGSSGETGIPDGCGDGEAQGMEECDGLDLRGAECTAFASPATGDYSGGQLACNDDCTLDHSSCTYCGDGVKNHASEECDGDDMGTLTCEDEGFDGGELSCSDQCGLVQAACENCEGNEAGMYGKANVGCQGGFADNGYNGCLVGCTEDSDCADPDLAICGNQPVCDIQENNADLCKILCDVDEDCPNGMVCGETSNYGVLCVWGS
jgi:hypothetical protein